MKQESKTMYADPGLTATYTDDAPRKVPGLADLHRMTMLLLAERAPAAAHILVVGAGGGLETCALAAAQPGWQFTGVDPSSVMLDLARRTTLPFADRIALLEGTVEQAPTGPFDGACCLLTLHHITRSERLETLTAIYRRLKPGAHFVMAQHVAPEPDALRWLERSVAFGDRSQTSTQAAATASAQVMTQRLHLLTPAQEITMLEDAGFVDVAMFYAALSFRGWVGTAGRV